MVEPQKQSTDTMFAPPPVEEAVLAAAIPEQYEFLGKVSEGGMGAICKAKNRYTGALYAIKLLKPGLAHDNILQQRFVMEAKAASLLNHPNICRVHDFGMKETTPYMAMEWIDGISLQSKVSRDGPLPVNEAISVFKQVADALSHAHGHSVVHRDLKPDNIMLTRTRASGRTQAYLVDFGIAKLMDSEDYARKEQLTQTGTVVGSPLYMSPEQARAHNLDGRSDIYSLGCVMYMALSGQPPFRGTSYIDTIYKHINDAPPPFAPDLKIPGALRNIVLKAMEKEAHDRYQTVEQLAADLDKIAHGTGVHVALSAKKKKTRAQILNVVYFVAAFVGIYGLSLALQDFLDARHVAPRTESQSQSQGMPAGAQPAGETVKETPAQAAKQTPAQAAKQTPAQTHRQRKH